MQTLLSSTLFVSSLFIQAPQTPQHVFTHVLPEENYVMYRTGKDETLFTIAKDRYGDESYWKGIWNDNPSIDNPEKIEEGTLIKLAITVPVKPADLNQEILSKYKVVYESTDTNETAVITPPVISPSKSVQPTKSFTISVSPSPLPKIASAPPSSYEEVYKQAGEKYGIPWQILYGIHMTETGGRNGAIFNGHGSGAEGPMQFMPGTWSAYGVDADGDGKADINNAVDAINGAANYLAKHGSLAAGLRSYGGNISGTLAYAREKGYSQ